ncbi:MAG: DUF4352 domain-containing protein [Chloroflexi bacterium]|nr:DUF4352 domain-containing protein [Chloroflexota bacterium]
MTKTLMFVLSGFLGSLIITACKPASGPVVPTPAPSASPQPTVEYKSLPTPVSPGRMVVYEDLQVTMSQTEITASYPTEYGSTREPPAGYKFLWIHITLKNIGQGGRDLPAPEHFSVLNGATEYKPTYGHRKDHVDYMDLTTGMVQGQAVDAWLRFDIPATLELKDLWFAFLPESSQISVGFSSSDYPWGDHPIYLWMCAP